MNCLCTRETHCGLEDKKCQRCPCNRCLQTAVSEFSNRKSLTSILFCTFVFLLYMPPPKPLTFWLTPKLLTYFSSLSLSNPEFPEWDSGENARENKNETTKRETKQAGNTSTPYSPSICTFQLMPFSFLQMEIQGRNQLLSDEMGSITGMIRQVM